MEESKTLERRGLAKGLKVWIDILFFLSILSAILIAIMGPLSMVSDRVSFQMRIPVSIGESSLLPVHRLEVSREALEGDIATDRQRAGDRIADPETGFTLVNARGELRFRHPPSSTRAVYLASVAILAGLLVMALILIRQILTTTAQGRPFDRRNPHRLNRLGWIILLTGVFLPYLQFRISKWVLSHYELTGTPVRAAFEFRQEWLFFGLVVLLLAAIWREAVRMAEEQSLTV
jgi:hypothetical protein